MISVAYITSRFDCRIGWFLASLLNQATEPIKIIVVDRYCKIRDKSDGLWKRVGEISNHIPPKPCVWSGGFKLTNQEFFSPANARNSAICVCDTEWLCFVDDLSVALPTWLNSVCEAMAGNYIALGAYKKVKELTVESGEVKHFKEFPAGIDSRWNMGRDDKAVHASANMLYGCSLAGPVEAFLKINGWDERCDAMGLGSEDQMAGFMLERQGYELKYDRRMLTYESEELHHVEPPMTRVIQKLPGREDSSWEMLRMVRDTGCKEAPNYFPEGGIRKERERVMAGQPFTVTQIPDRDWYSGRLLSEL